MQQSLVGNNSLQKIPNGHVNFRPGVGSIDQDSQIFINRTASDTSVNLNIVNRFYKS